MTPEFAESYERNFPSSGQYCETREEYFTALNKWLRDVQMWQSAMSYVTHVMSRHPHLVPNHEVRIPNTVNNTHTAGSAGDANNIGPPLRPNFPWFTPANQPNVNQTDATGLRYRIPPLWKRLVAELLDWVILFMVKLVFTFALVDFLNVIDIGKYDINMIQNVTYIQYDVAIDLMSHILFIELVYRIVSCIAEAYLLQEGVNGRIGGATLGKAVLGLKVVLCHKVASIPGQPQNVVLVTPGTNLGLGLAVARSVAKSVVVIVFPTCIVPFLFGFNRTAYDVLCHSIVVEDPDEQPRRQAGNAPR